MPLFINAFTLQFNISLDSGWKAVYTIFPATLRGNETMHFSIYPNTSTKYQIRKTTKGINNLL